MRDLEKNSSVQQWMKKIRSEGTKNLYLRYLNMFCDHVGITPDELIQERIIDLKSDDKFIQRRAEDRVEEWFNKLDKEKARNTAVTTQCGIKSFYKHNYYELKMDNLDTWPKKMKASLTREDLGRLLQAAKKPLHQAYILCASQSGISVSDMLRVPSKEVKRQVTNRYIHLRMMRGKRKEVGFFDTFFGRMATQAAKEHLKTRRNRTAEHLFTCSTRNVNDFLERISNRAGFEAEEKVSSHTLRMYFNTMLKLGRVNDPAFNETLIEYWMGHSLGKVKGAYFIPPFQEQLRLYKLAEQRLEPVIEAN